MAAKKRSTHLTDLNGYTVSADAFAQLMNVSRQTVYDWVKREGLTKEGRGYFPLIASVQWMVERLTTKNALAITDTTVARQRLVEGQAINVELKNRREAGELVPVNLLNDVAVEITTLCLTQLEQVPDWATDDEQKADFRERVEDSKRVIEYRLREIASTNKSR